MASDNPQHFEIPISDQLFQTRNPADPIIGIAPSAQVPVNIPWNQDRTDLVQIKGKSAKVSFGKVKWSGAGTGPHAVYEDRLDGKRVKIGTISWSIESVVYQEWLKQGNKRRLRITPCPILTRTFKPTGGAPESIEVSQNPQPCYGNWVPVA